MGKTIFNMFIKLFPSSVKIDLFPSISFVMNLNDLTQRSTFWQGERFEYPTAKVLREYSQGKCKIFFDIGSNYGFYSYFVYSFYDNVNCYAFEPNPTTFHLMERIIMENKLSRIKCYPLGLGDKRCKLCLHPGIEDSGHSTFIEHPELYKKSVGEVQIVTFDEWRKENKIVIPIIPEWMVKIDVEGYELNVLKGMEESLVKKAFMLLSVEINPFTLNLNNTYPNDIYKYLKRFNYRPLNSENLKSKYGNLKTDNVFFIPF